ncbi:hypothetical protein NECAME_01496 [Necator americanus]|uniref:Uncharacterized protein n=1 Tax=Necator americanus TaxID=51031 RepID=W2TV44_NECAM|nr:hypothetical protein NECAME_01496 [Necator americanus]ETN84936.1 hypothetical protein NECAME_01496 [Necator americanus]
MIGALGIIGGGMAYDGLGTRCGCNTGSSNGTGRDGNGKKDDCTGTTRGRSGGTGPMSPGFRVCRTGGVVEGLGDGSGNSDGGDRESDDSGGADTEAKGLGLKQLGLSRTVLNMSDRTDINVKISSAAAQQRQSMF